jgi:hypothetical protein
MRCSPLSTTATTAVGALVALAGLLPTPAFAQQYAGEVIPNTLPTVNGASISFFNIPDKKKKPTTLITYMSAPNGKRQDEKKVQRAVIALHGLQRDSALYWQSVAVSLASAKKINPAINEESVSIIAPYFPNGDDKNIGYPWVDGKPAGQGSVSSFNFFF